MPFYYFSALGGTHAVAVSGDLDELPSDGSVRIVFPDGPVVEAELRLASSPPSGFGPGWNGIYRAADNCLELKHIG